MRAVLGGSACSHCGETQASGVTPGVPAKDGAHGLEADSAGRYGQGPGRLDLEKKTRFKTTEKGKADPQSVRSGSPIRKGNRADGGRLGRHPLEELL